MSVSFQSLLFFTLPYALACTHVFGCLLGKGLYDVTMLWFPIEGHSPPQECSTVSQISAQIPDFLWQILALSHQLRNVGKSFTFSVPQFPQLYLLHHLHMRLEWIANCEVSGGAPGLQKALLKCLLFWFALDRSLVRKGHVITRHSKSLLTFVAFLREKHNELQISIDFRGKVGKYQHQLLVRSYHCF